MISNVALRIAQLTKNRAKQNGYQLANQPTARTIAGLIGVKCAKTCAVYSKIRLLFRIHFAPRWSDSHFQC
ncbi:hypothetical protein C5027_02845 [Salmonella enterica subsp. enterica serovar Derby]|nr:hypothetical protein [Salmonella enterica subsp. enterica serovar Derby]